MDRTGSCGALGVMLHMAALALVLVIVAACVPDSRRHPRYTERQFATICINSGFSWAQCYFLRFGEVMPRNSTWPEPQQNGVPLPERLNRSRTQ